MKETYLKHFEVFRKSAGSGPPWLAELQAKGIEDFSSLGLPTMREELWRHTDVSPITKTEFHPALGSEPSAVSDLLGRFRFGSTDESFLAVAVNGFFSREASRLEGLPNGVVIRGLADAARAHPKLVQANLAQLSAKPPHAFAALNKAFLQDGIYVSVPDGVVLSKPIVLLNLSRSGDRPTITFPRQLIVIGAQSEVRLVEIYAGDTRGDYVANAMTEIVLGANSTLVHTKVGLDDGNAYHVGASDVKQHRDSCYRSHVFVLGGSIVRNDLSTVLVESGSECALNGLYLLRENQLVDNHTEIDHVDPACTSRELYKGILDESSHGVFNGKVIVRKGAQKSDAQQSNKNLVLSKDAVIDTTPQLEIYADDVKCKHGATIGKLDETQLFYLRSRGLRTNEAQRLLVTAFANEIVEKLSDALTQAFVRRCVEERLAA